ncbi:MAG: exodeoxyribonuclease VII large subunit [Acidobacteria bacterium 13_1_40CM_2_64_6]|nr:MAG: exodeoxyribonuclease VII large subunit [Acidobacteria bacterium 13_1_40CM_2_64_6]
MPFEEEEPEPEAPPAPAPAAVRRVLSVTELTVKVRDLLEAELFEVWVEGELSNCRVWNTGHLYFTLKDESTQLRGFMFRSALRSLKFKPTDGTRVVARGKISVYEPKGEYQLVCEHLEPQGLGALQLAFEQLKKRLQAEGLFDGARKRPLPALPRKIGIVTSLDGAAIRDIINVLRRRYANAHLVIRPARVQGEGAAIEVAQGLRQIGRVPGVDVVIVGRGGGSIEDLWAFNEEIVARAIAKSPVPVIAAVGHETDVTIADFVADVRAPTPSAAAELVVSRKDEFFGRIDRLSDRLRAAARGRVQRLSRRVHVADSRPAFAGQPGRVAMRGRHAAELTHALARLVRASLATRDRRLHQLERQLTTFDAGRRLSAIRMRLVTVDGRMRSAATRRQDRARAQFQETAGRLDTLSPLAVLGRGYAVAWNADKTRVLRDGSAVAPGDTVHVTLARGELECEVHSSADRTQGPPGTQSEKP